MRQKPSTAAGYAPELAEEARSLCLYVATILGDLWGDVVVIGGLAPYLIVDQQRADVRRHVGTRDLDLGFSLAVLGEERYREISGRLRERGFRPEPNAAGNPMRQTWGHEATRVTIDFLIAETGAGSKPGRLQSLEPDFAAIVTPGLALAFVDAVVVELEGVTPTGELARREVQVCGPAAFVVLKALALRFRGANKDAYDLVYVLENYGTGVGEVAARFHAIAAAAEAQLALRYLDEDFLSEGHVGPKRRAHFISGGDDDVLQAEAFGLVATFLATVGGRR